MAHTKARRPAVRPHAFIPDAAVLDARGQSRSCAICTLGPTNVCHPQASATSATSATSTTTIPEIPAYVAEVEARRLGERLEDD